jgi:hypothetical protein
MVVCPNCKSEISKVDLFLDHNFRCESCSTVLVQKYKKYTSYAVGILAGLNGVIALFIISNYPLVFILFALIYILEIWFIYNNFIRLEIAESPRYIEPLEPYPFKIS